MSRRDPMVPVRHMLNHAREAVEMVQNRSRTDLDTDRMLNLAFVRLLEVVGEAATRVPEEFQSRHPQVPWRDVADLRHRLIHAYDTVDFDILWTILHDDLPALIAQLQAIVAEGP
ncbi:MAG: DUF86 domain-containing protein [SAR202 cluster bacterium]|nr:DUF86 domain-containing protein [SAR202 cluster bacterium]